MLYYKSSPILPCNEPPMHLYNKLEHSLKLNKGSVYSIDNDQQQSTNNGIANKTQRHVKDQHYFLFYAIKGMHLNMHYDKQKPFVLLNLRMLAIIIPSNYPTQDDIKIHPFTFLYIMIYNGNNSLTNWLSASSTITYGLKHDILTQFAFLYDWTNKSTPLR